MRELGDYHHFRQELIPASDRVARCERHVAELLLCGLTDAERESSVVFELKHHHSVAQFGRVLARKRGLPVDLATVGCLVHDIHVIVNGTYKDHAHLGAPIAMEVLAATGEYSQSDRDAIYALVYHHSDKHIASPHAWEEFGKDADVLDCFLYPNAFEYYLRHKTLAIFEHYLRRAARVWGEIGMPHDPRFDLLRGFTSPWLTYVRQVPRSEAATVIARLVSKGVGTAGEPAPPFLVQVDAEDVYVALNRDQWEEQASAGVDTVFARLVEEESERPPTAVAEEPVIAALLSRCEEARAAAMFWPALGGYDVMDGAHPRWNELGTEPIASVRARRY